jgi:excisionase family DNA binding protein
MIEDRSAAAPASTIGAVGRWPHSDRWLFVDEIAAYLGIKRDTVCKWISEKQIRSCRMGRLWTFRKEEVHEWVKTGGADNSRIDDSGKPVRSRSPVCVRNRTGRRRSQD